jgi:alkanesulfonate monooxygenase SsuD/methylene tetrahydromethanopterin reductase-like flavin-dependent oxidoreductase (luciferase family)
MLALYIGGMGAKDKNFYNELTRRFGYEAAAEEIQNLYLDGKRAEAIAAVPDELVDELALCGSKERVREHLQDWASSPINTMIIQAQELNTVRTMAELVL